MFIVHDPLLETALAFVADESPDDIVPILKLLAPMLESLNLFMDSVKINFIYDYLIESFDSFVFIEETFFIIF